MPGQFFASSGARRDLQRDYVRFALIDNKARIRPAVHGIKAMLQRLGRRNSVITKALGRNPVFFRPVSFGNSGPAVGGNNTIAFGVSKGGIINL